MQTLVMAPVCAFVVTTAPGSSSSEECQPTGMLTSHSVYVPGTRPSNATPSAPPLPSVVRVSTCWPSGPPESVNDHVRPASGALPSSVLTTTALPRLVLVNVQTTVSPASMSSVATRLARLVDESAPAPVHASAVRSQPAVTDSVTVCAPSCAAVSV